MQMQPSSYGSGKYEYCYASILLVYICSTSESGRNGHDIRLYCNILDQRLGVRSFILHETW